ncbi:MAG: RNA-dependent ATPase rok1 [Chaenotheca gracillima]|nr:MAG: RNA-dependent ATPase rok1 [Chaenotheca gracillima]
MDPLKLLTRSTTLSRSYQSRPSGSAKKTPSAGQNSAPHIFTSSAHKSPPQPGEDSTAHNRKRKRGQDVTRPDDDIANELNYFGNSSRNDESANESDTANTRSLDKVVLEPAAHENGYERLGEEECKKVFKQHKLKITVLAEGGPATKDRKSKKSKAKVESRKVTAGSKKRDKYNAQLFTQPLVSFDQLPGQYGVSRKLRQNIRNQGYLMPTEVQIASLPLLLSSTSSGGDLTTNGTSKDKTGDEVQDERPADLLAVAPTGSGKTLAFLVPILNDLVKQRQASSDEHKRGPEGRFNYEHGIRAVIVAPTKELASQITNEGRKLAVGTGIKVTLMRKGMRVVEAGDVDKASMPSESEEGSDSDEDKISQGKTASTTVKSDVLITTPLTLVNAMKGSSIPESSPLPLVKHLVLDEADVLLDPLFRPQTLAIWEACKNSSLHTSLWSATMGSNIESLVSSTISARHSADSSKATPFRLLRLVVGLKDSAIPTIAHHLTYTATEPGKLLALRQLLRPSAASKTGPPPARPPVLIFTQTIPRAIALHAELQYDIPAEAGGSSRIAVLHADLSDTIRSRIMARFRSAEIWVLITTDLLARGVDFRGVNAVINYDVPNSAAAYVHRVGRTGRAGREGGMAVTLYTKEDIGHIKAVANVIAASEKVKARDAKEAGGEVHEAAGDSSITERGGVQKWLLDALPTPSKKDKQNLKKRGVEARRTTPAMTGADGKLDSAKAREVRRMRISTKSGFDRRLEDRRKAGVRGGKSRGVGRVATGANAEEADEDFSEWSGFGDD